MAVLDGTTLHPGQDDEERKKRRRNLIILLAILLVALGVIACFLISSLSVSKVSVPDVTGVPQSVATQTLKNDGLALGTVTFKTTASPRTRCSRKTRPPGPRWTRTQRSIWW